MFVHTQELFIDFSRTDWSALTRLNKSADVGLKAPLRTLRLAVYSPLLAQHLRNAAERNSAQQAVLRVADLMFRPCRVVYEAARWKLRVLR
jgi:hypothetical protein